ncbi:MAG: Rpn family recombination-promoting nuclease/putative transposase [Gammaproteobacteria bacterium]|nr:Rpn family recombination-promoting nuclease/putative transposase [Gammaproteobacteria bacterium]
MRQDPTFKDIFAYPFMVEELLRWFVGDLQGARELVDGLDFSGLARVQEQSTTGPPTDKRSYANDIVWRVPFRDRAEADRTWLHIVVMIEVQGDVDYLMALRIRNYVDNHYLDLWRGQRFRSTDRLAPVLPVVIYTGAQPWSAAVRVIDLVTPKETGDAHPDPASRRSGLFVGDGYLTLDTLRLATDDLRHDNAAALLAGLCNPTFERLPAQAAALRARLATPALRPLLEVALRWAEQTAQRTIGFDLGVDDMAEVDRLDESGELEAYFAERRRAYQEQYRKEGLEQGKALGIATERALLQRLASRKFGAGADARLAPLLADIENTDTLATVGEWIIDCDTSEELVARLAAGSHSGTT